MYGKHKGAFKPNIVCHFIAVPTVPSTPANLHGFDRLFMELAIRLDASTFNILLKGNRLCSTGIRGKLVAAHLNEMIECDIPADSYTIVELLAMCAQSPRAKTMKGSMTNKQVADAEYQYYIQRILPRNKWGSNACIGKDAKFPSAYVFNTYLDVYASDGDVRGMYDILRTARQQNIIGGELDQQLKNTLAKGNTRAALQTYNSSKVSKTDWWYHSRQ